MSVNAIETTESAIFSANDRFDAVVIDETAGFARVIGIAYAFSGEKRKVVRYKLTGFNKHGGN